MTNAAYGPEEIVATELFRGPNADEQVAEHADVWRLNLLLKGFEEIGIGNEDGPAETERR